MNHDRSPAGAASQAVARAAAAAHVPRARLLALGTQPRAAVRVPAGARAPRAPARAPPQARGAARHRRGAPHQPHAAHRAGGAHHAGQSGSKDQKVFHLLCINIISAERDLSLCDWVRYANHHAGGAHHAGESGSKDQKIFITYQNYRC